MSKIQEDVLNLADEIVGTVADMLTSEHPDYFRAVGKVANIIADREQKAKTAQMPVWQSMETAPKDGKHSIFAIKFGPFVYAIQGVWDHHDKKWINAADREGEYLAWMPNVMLPDEFCPWTDEYKARILIAKQGAQDERKDG